MVRDENPIPYLVTRRWVYDQRQVWWHGDERSSPVWMSRVRGQFPDQAENAIVKLAWLERARERARRNPVEDTGSPLIAGVDVGGGEAETVVCLVELSKPNPKVLKFEAWRGQDTRGQVVAFLRPYRDRLIQVRVDADGDGHNFGLHLRDQGYRGGVEFVHVGLPVESQPGRNDPSPRFFNQKAQFYQHIADLLERDAIDGLRDEMTIGQLAGILYELDPRGRIKIESKEDARKRGVRSPDRAEALMLALGKPRPVYEYYSVYDRRRLRSERENSESAEHPYFGFRMVGDDDDEPSRSLRQQLKKLL
jgi:phage terminase large subunit